MKYASLRLDDSWLQAAAAAEARGDLDDALRLWCAYRQLHPSVADGYLDPCRALRKAGRLEEAQALLDEAAGQKFAAGLPVMMELARVAEARDDLQVALHRWQAAAAAFPRNGLACAGAGRMLLKLNRIDEAEAYVTAAAARLPDDPQLARLFAQLAAAREDWPEAVRRWDLLIAKYPNDQGAMRGRGAAIWQTRMLSSAATPDDAPNGLVDVGRVADPAANALVTRFESLGQNCEFGLVQRRYGAEPLGLLRWASVKPNTLEELLKTRFAGLGEPEHVHVNRTAWGEYCIQDSLFNLTFHTFMTGEIADTQAFLAKQAARLRWLRDKLLADLEEGAKIFVFKALTPTPAQQLDRIMRALRVYGGAKLLWVELAGTLPAGRIEDCGGGLLRGSLSVINPVRRGSWDIPFEEWLALCRAAATL